jgi:cell wall-associated NlpC family hydrolase
VERLPIGRQFASSSRGKRSRARSHRAWARSGLITGTILLAGFALPASLSVSAQATTASSAAAGSPVPTTMKALLAKANKLARQVEVLSNQYDALKIQYQEAKTESVLARKAALRDAKQLTAGQLAVGQIAAQGYMTGSFDPTLQMLQSSDPQGFVNRVSIMLQLQHENGDRVSAATVAKNAAERALLTAQQQEDKANKLSAAMQKKVAEIQAKENVLNSAAYKKAAEIFQQTGSYPNLPTPQGNSIGVQALRWALTRRGDAYVWGGSGPDVFDCSGLVMWAYSHVGISLAHLTFDQWNEGEHVPTDQAQPGDLIFLYGLEHVGMYIGNGLFINAPHTGTVVQIAPVPWDSVDGVVRIIG